MKNISEIINMSNLSYYMYLEELNVIQCRGDATISTLYQQKELIKIINILDNNNINYTVDEKYNIALENS